MLRDRLLDRFEAQESEFQGGFQGTYTRVRSIYYNVKTWKATIIYDYKGRDFEYLHLTKVGRVSLESYPPPPIQTFYITQIASDITDREEGDFFIEFPTKTLATVVVDIIDMYGDKSYSIGIRPRKPRQ